MSSNAVTEIYETVNIEDMDWDDVDEKYTYECAFVSCVAWLCCVCVHIDFLRRMFLNFRGDFGRKISFF